MTDSFSTRLACAASLAACLVLGGVFAVPARAATVTTVPTGTTIDSSFDVTQPFKIVGEGQSSKVGCPDRNFNALPVWSNSVLGCNVIGTSDKVKVTYGWKVDGSGAAIISAKGFNAKRQPTWYAAGNGTGRTIAISWGNVAAAKQIQGMTMSGSWTKVKFS